MKVFSLWYGGNNYSCPSMEDIEEFRSIQSAKDSFWSRSDYDPYYPCVDRPEMQLYFTDPRKAEDPYPDMLITMGPRGGVRIERL